jgi:putative nucleotidyltransferase with HDIG domain
MTDVRKRILFVDDDLDVLGGLRHALSKDRRRWDMVFMPGAGSALDEIHKQSFDVVISDMRMPGIDGATFLNAVKLENPASVRIMLSGHADRELIVRALPALHQLLTKPCDITTLRATIERSLGGADIVRDGKILELIGNIDKLPTPPDLYFDLMRLLQSPVSNVAEIGKLVTRDPGIAAKLLQLVNSSYFGTGHKTSSIHQAVTLLGTEALRFIALTASVFTAGLPGEYGLWVHELQETSMRVASLACAFSAPADRDEAFAAALLHDVGHLVFALVRPTEFRELNARVENPTDALAGELAVFGASHADVGARLLAIWGVPVAIVNAVQSHHAPWEAPEGSRKLASLVHVADAIIRAGAADPVLDRVALDHAGCAEWVDSWLAAAQRLS